MPALSTILRVHSKSKSPLVSSIHGHALARDVDAAKYLECSAQTQENLTSVFEEAVRAVLYPKAKKKKRAKEEGGGKGCRIM